MNRIFREHRPGFEMEFRHVAQDKKRIADSWVESRQGRSKIARHFNGGMKAKNGPASPAGTAERFFGDRGECDLKAPSEGE